MAKVCIITQKEVKSGYLVEDDIVIRAIRRAKRALGIAKNNTLVVSDEGLAEYHKKRSAYEKSIAKYAILAGVVFIVVVILPLFTAGLSLNTLYAMLLGLFLSALIMVLPVLSHVPKIAGAPVEAEGGLGGTKAPWHAKLSGALSGHMGTSGADKRAGASKRKKKDN